MPDIKRSLLTSLEQAGTLIFSIFSELGQMLSFFYESLRVFAKKRVRLQFVIEEVYELGVNAFAIISIASIATGMVLAVQGAQILRRFGATEYIANMVALSLVRELGPVLTSLLFIGKSGAKVSAELGAMNVNEQLLAARAMGIEPLYFFGLPRMIGCIIALPILVFWSEVLGIAGSMIISVFQENIRPAAYLYQTFQSLSLVDFAGGLIKTLFFAMLIGFVSTYKGFRTQGGSTGVGTYTTQAVALSSLSVIIANFLLTKVLINFWG